MLAQGSHSAFRSPASCELEGAGKATGGLATFAPAVGDGQPPVASEGLEADLGTGRVLAPLVLRAIDQPCHPVDERGIEAHRHDLGMPTIAFDVVVENVVEQLVRWQRVGVLLTR